MEDRPPLMFSQLKQNADGSWTANILLCEFPLDESFMTHVRADPRNVTAEWALDGVTISLTATFPHTSDAYNFLEVYRDFMRDIDRDREEWGATYYGAAYGREPRGREQFLALYPHLAELVWDEPPPGKPEPPGKAVTYRDWVSLSMWLLQIKCWLHGLRKYVTRTPRS